MNARLEGVGEARKDFRRAMCEVAEIALEDTRISRPTLGPTTEPRLKDSSGRGCAPS